MTRTKSCGNGDLVFVSKTGQKKWFVRYVSKNRGMIEFGKVIFPRNWIGKNVRIVVKETR